MNIVNPTIIGNMTFDLDYGAISFNFESGKDSREKIIKALAYIDENGPDASTFYDLTEDYYAKEDGSDNSMSVRIRTVKNSINIDEVAKKDSEALIMTKGIRKILGKLDDYPYIDSNYGG